MTTGRASRRVRSLCADYLRAGCCLLPAILQLACGSQSNETLRIEIKIGALFGGDSFDRSGYVAFLLAIDYVNSREDILPNITLSSVTSHDSTDGTFDTIKRACTLLRKEPITIIGPTTTADVKAVSPIFDSLQIPHLTSAATDSTLSIYREQYPYLFKMSPPDNFQSAAIIDILNYYGWKRIGIIASLTDYGRNGAINLQSEALKRDWTITSILYFLPNCNLTDTLSSSLLELKNKGTRVMILHCQAKYARVVLEVAYSLGMINKGWAWIATDGVSSMDELYNSCADVPSHMQGIIGLRAVHSSGSLYADFTNILKNGTEISAETNFVANVFDAVLATSYALHDYILDGHVLNPPRFDNNTCTTGRLRPWSEGQLLADYIAKVTGEGVAHYINFTEDRYPGITKYNILNLRKKGWKQVGDWAYDGEEGHLNIEDPIFFSGMTGTVPSDTAIDLRNIMLRVVTITEEPFTMEKKDTNYTGHMKYEGYCIDLLTRLQETLGFQYELYVVPDGNFGVEDPKTGQWNGMVGELVHDRADLAVASLTINYEREQVIDFTKPFQDLGNLILVAKESAQQSLFAFMDPFSMRLWLVVGGAYILCGLVTTLVSWLSPFGKRGAFSSSPDTVRDKYKPDRNVFNLWNSLWHTFSMWSTQGAEVAPNSLSGRLVYGAWYFTVMVISATYTANLAAFLTVQRLETGIDNLQDLANQQEIKYGVVLDTATYQFFQVQMTEPYRTVYKTMEERSTYVLNSTMGLQLVCNSYGKPLSQRYAFIHDSIPLEYAANQIPCHTVTIGRLFNQFGYGLALQKNSPYVDLFSLEILKLRQSGYLNSIYTKWVLSGTCQIEDETSSDGEPAQQATLIQMVGVFILMGSLLILAILVIPFEYCAVARSDKKKDSSLSFHGALMQRCRSVRADVKHNMTTCLCCKSDHDVQHESEIQRGEIIRGYDMSSVVMAQDNRGFVADADHTPETSATVQRGNDANNVNTSKL